MNNFSLAMKTAASLLLVGVLAACSSSNDPAPVAGTPPATTFTVSGTAATGAALDNATITIIGSDGTTYPAAGEAPIVTAADGSYTIILPLSAKPPFVVQAVRDDISLVSVIAEAKDTTTNITSVTNLIASRLSSSGDPAKLAAEFLADPTLLDLAKITAKVAEVVALIQPLMDAVGDSTNPLNGNIQAAVTAGTGADKMLDSLSITITPSGANTVNIEVSVKQKQAEGEQPVVIAFSGGANATAPATALPTVVATDLVPSGNAALIADLLQRMTACVALPSTTRVNGTGASNIVAPECLDVFWSKDPTTFLSNGARVSSTGAFSGLFGTGSGAVFDRGTYEFTRGGTGPTNGDLVIAYRQSDPVSGSSTNSTLAVRTDTDGKLRVIGNQYKYNGAVNAYQQLRTFINVTGADYYSTGYSLYVNNSADVQDVVKVVVTTPKGGTLTLKPSAGSAYFPLVKTSSAGVETITGTSFLRIRSVYIDAANAANNPSTADTSLFFALTPLSDAEIATIPAQGTWKFEYYLAGQTTPDATQYYKTRSRAMTIAELQTQPMAKLATADIDYVKANTKTNTTTGGLFLPTPATGPVTLTWEVPTNALGPTSIQVYGTAAPVAPSTTRPNFNDKTGVASTARTGNIVCSAASINDKHCDGTGNYATGDSLNGAHLWTNDAAGREFASFYAIYAITP